MPDPNAPSVFETRICESLQRHRDELPIALPLQLSVSHLLDSHRCLVLTQDLQALGSPWERATATPELADMLPTCGGLYMFVWAPVFVLTTVQGNGTREHRHQYVLYVGRASGDAHGTIRKRYKKEYRKYVCQDPERLWDLETAAGRSQLLKKYLNLWPLEFWHKEVENPEQITNLERRLIRMLSPPLNLHLKPRFKLAKREPAFT